MLLRYLQQFKKIQFNTLFSNNLIL